MFLENTIQDVIFQQTSTLTWIVSKSTTKCHFLSKEPNLLRTYNISFHFVWEVIDKELLQKIKTIENPIDRKTKVEPPIKLKQCLN